VHPDSSPVTVAGGAAGRRPSPESVPSLPKSEKVKKWTWLNRAEREILRCEKRSVEEREFIEGRGGGPRETRGA